MSHLTLENRASSVDVGPDGLDLTLGFGDGELTVTIDGLADDYECRYAEYLILAYLFGAIAARDYEPVDERITEPQTSLVHIRQKVESLKPEIIINPYMHLCV